MIAEEELFDGLPVAHIVAFNDFHRAARRAIISARARRNKIMAGLAGGGA